MTTPSPTSSSTTRQAAKIAGLIFLGVLLMCGIAGTCLLIVSFFIPTGSG